MTPLYKIPGLLLLPSSLVLLLLILALVATKPWRQLSLLAAIGLIVFGSVGPLSSSLLAERESQVPVPLLEVPDVIVVLGHGHQSNPDLSLVSHFYYAGLARVTQAVSLAQQFPQARLFFTGYGGSDPVSNADKAAELAQSLGLDPKRISTYPEPRNTAEEAAAVKPDLNNQNTLLVTSASHLPRALAAFKSAGIENIVGYPTGHLVKNAVATDWYSWWPRANNWLVFETWVYEQLADIRHWLIR